MNDQEADTHKSHGGAIIWPTLRAGQFAEVFPQRTNRTRKQRNEGLAGIEPVPTRFTIFYVERSRSWISPAQRSPGIGMECPSQAAEDPQDARTRFLARIALPKGEKLESPQRVRL